mmetsp:Transcript_22258/g.33653  ORF Transcript_22258/g.33653 Transcript_22258/m.33653 type:complete len:214 (-) Transcript_22258:252-893(-)
MEGEFLDFGVAVTKMQKLKKTKISSILDNAEAVVEGLTLTQEALEEGDQIEAVEMEGEGGGLLDMVEVTHLINDKECLTGGSITVILKTNMKMNHQKLIRKMETLLRTKVMVMVMVEVMEITLADVVGAICVVGGEVGDVLVVEGMDHLGRHNQQRMKKSIIMEMANRKKEMVQKVQMARIYPTAEEAMDGGGAIEVEEAALSIEVEEGMWQI